MNVTIRNNEPRIEGLSEKKLLGMHLSMSYADNRTGELWRSFMMRRKEIKNAVSSELYSMQIYPSTYDFQSFDPHAVFEKWAAAEVFDYNGIPQGMEPYILPGGLYAVFIHQGAAATASEAFRYIFGTWLPHSGYTLDNRPHFEVLGEKYKNDDPESEEEIWIPIRKGGESTL